MLIELFVDPIVVNGEIKQKVSSFRYGRHPKTVNQPNKHNVFEIMDNDIRRLVFAMDHTAILCSEQDADFSSGSLFLKIIDDAKGNVEKDNFLQSVTWDESVVVEVIDWDKKKYKIENLADSVFAKHDGKIIGNVTSDGKQKVYHLPTDKWYDKVEYDKERGDMLFDTEEEAVNAGFEPAVAPKKTKAKVEETVAE